MAKQTPANPILSSSEDKLRLEALFPTLDIDFTLPALASFSGGQGVLFIASGAAKTRAIEAVQSVILRLLAAIPPGKLRLLFIDPLGLGQNMAPFMSLSDYEESLITSRAWSEPRHIEQRLADITEHMETVIQKYLRSEFATIDDYNDKAGEVAEPYRLVIVIDFPVNFNEETARRLQSIAQNGPRCGVYTFVVLDHQKKLPYGFKLEDFTRVCEVITWEKDRFTWQAPGFSSCFLELDRLPPDELVKRIVTTVGAQAKEAMKVEVPFAKLLQLADLGKDSWWNGKTGKKLEIPLGPAGARKVQQLIFGEGTAHHALIVGRPGSGKSNLMHIIITAAALIYSPDEVQFYLVDFKKGVEFNSYTKPPLPHARVVAIESEREFGLSVLQGLDAELQRRGELFRQSDVKSFGECQGKIAQALPRIILLVDEFQEFFVQEDSASRMAGLILDRLVRQGRAFGMHVLLGSQTLAGSYSLPRSTMDQMAVRIALQCSDADSRLILADDNPAARLLSRPGEAIYNTHSGLVEGNQLFQVALFSDEDRDRYLTEVTRLARGNPAKNYPPTIIFAGHEPALLANCDPLKELLSRDSWPAGSQVTEAFLGEPIAIRPPIAARFHRQSGSHLLVVTRDEAEAIGVLAASVLSLALQQSPQTACFHIVDFSSPDAPWADLPEELAALLPHTVEVLGRRDLPSLLTRLHQLVQQRLENTAREEQSHFLVFVGLHRARDLRQEEHGYGLGGFGEGKSLSLPEQFAYLLREGPEAGVHCLCWCDVYSNLMRVLDRRSLGEFTLRVTGVMSSDDSMHLLDDAAASRLDKPHRMIFFDENRPGVLEKFRPYAVPAKEWLLQIGKALQDRRNVRIR